MVRDGNLSDPDLRARAVNAAQGKCPFDVLIENVRVLDIVTGRERRADIGIVGPMIASVLPPSEHLDAAERIDGEGAVAVPGLIDTHMHIESSMVTPAEYAAAVLPRGVTTAVWDPHEFANACGVPGVEFAVEAAGNLPLRVLTLAPTCVPSAPGYESCGGDFGPETVAGLLQRPDIYGAAELMTMQPLLNGDPRVTGIANAAVSSGKLVCGHARGLSGGDLAAYAAAGVESDHELTSAADLLARLEAGMTVELRGSHEHLLPELTQALIALGHMPQTVTLCTDDVFPDDLHARGGVDRVLRLLMEHGLPAAWAYRAATLNAATRLRRADLGLLAPGRRADIALISDVKDVSAEMVLADGLPVAQSGTLRVEIPRTKVPPELHDTVRVPELDASDFEIETDKPRATIATLAKPRFPVWGKREVTVTDGKLDLPDDMIRMSVVNRYGQQSPVRVAFLEKWGTWRGAFASTVSHDSHNLTVFGRDAADMALAANAVRKSGGGLAVVSRGRVIAQLDLPVAGLVSDKPLEQVATEFAELRRALDTLVDWQPPYLVFKALFGASLVCNAGPRLSDIGLVDVFEGRILESCIINHDQN